MCTYTAKDRGAAPQASLYRERPGPKLDRQEPDGSHPNQLQAMEVLANRSPQARLTARLGETMNASPRPAVPCKQCGTEPLQRRENRTGMPDDLKTGLERLSGLDLSGVRVHHNSPQPARLAAHAFTQGQDIHIAPGQERHLPHEGWHAVQQMQQRVQPTARMQGVSINDSPVLEREADRMGSRAAQIRSPQSMQHEAGSQVSQPIQRTQTIQRAVPWDPAANVAEIAEENAQNARLGPGIAAPSPVRIGPQQAPGGAMTVGNQKHFDPDMLREVVTILNYLPPQHVIGNPSLTRVVMDNTTANNPGISNY